MGRFHHLESSRCKPQKQYLKREMLYY